MVLRQFIGPLDEETVTGEILKALEAYPPN